MLCGTIVEGMEPVRAPVTTRIRSDEEIVQWIRRRMPEARVVYRFGSSVTGDEHAESDLDLAVLATGPFDPVRRWQIQEDLAAAVGRDVDLIDLLRASTVLQMQVVSTGVVLWSGDETERHWFEMVTYSSYARLNEERKEILEQIRREGRVLGE